MSQLGGDSCLDLADIRLFQSGDLADATIICGGRSWNVHKVILSSRCKWFRAAFYGKMEEATSGKVVLQEQDPKFIDIMLRFIYARSVDFYKLRNGKDVPSICVELYRLADFFLLDELASLTKRTLEGYLFRRMEGQDADKTFRPETLTEVLDSVKRAYQDDSTKPFRQTLLTFLCIRKDRYLQTPDVIALLGEIPELAMDLMKTCLSVDLTTSQHNKQELPRSLPVLEAVDGGLQAYAAGGPRRVPRHGDNKLTRTPCVLLPRPQHESSFSMFSVVNTTTNVAVPDLMYLVPSASIVRVIRSNNNSSIVQIVTHSLFGGRRQAQIRFVCPADAKHYVDRYRNAVVGLEDVVMTTEGLEEALQVARDSLFH